jgi:GT2 family glycosyltransferase
MKAGLFAPRESKAKQTESMQSHSAACERATWSAAVINYNGGGLVADTIASIEELENPPDEILLIDDGSSDDSIARVERSHPNVRIVQMERHTARPTMVRNRALREARHRHVLLTDNDVSFAPDAVQQLMAVMLERPDAALCTPLVVCDDDRDTVYGQAHRLHFLCWGTFLRARTVAAARAIGPHRAVGCGIQLIDKVRAEAAGFFDENLVFGWGDDGALHHRLHLAGWACYTVPDALVFHRRLRTTPRIYGQIHNRWVVLLTDFQLRTLLLTAPALLLFELMLVASALSLRAGGEYLRALRDVARKLGPIRATRSRVQSSRRISDRDVLCADDLDLPRRSSPLDRFVRLSNVGFRAYWRIVGPLL